VLRPRLLAAKALGVRDVPVGDTAVGGRPAGADWTAEGVGAPLGKAGDWPRAVPAMSKMDAASDVELER